MTETKPKLKLLICAALVVAVVCVDASASKRRKSRPQVDEVISVEAPAEPAPNKNEVYVKLTDGTRVTVEEAWETEQGIWYRKGGMTQLIRKDHTKGIERGVDARHRSSEQLAKVLQPNQQQTPAVDQPVWIYLVGGARVEADGANESAAGVWYKRGSLSIFIERSRIDHIERETLETVAESDSSSKRARGWSTGRPKIDALIRQNGVKYGVDPYLIFCVMEQESHFNTYAQSPKGARGLMQLMPGTAAHFGVRHSFDPGQNIAGGTRYLKQLMAKFNNRVELVLASYNAGEGAVVRFGHRVPPYRETRNYVKRISFRYRQVKTPASPQPRMAVSAGGL